LVISLRYNLESDEISEKLQMNLGYSDWLMRAGWCHL